jgi:hypothetical protein
MADLFSIALFAGFAGGASQLVGHLLGPPKDTRERENARLELDRGKFNLASQNFAAQREYEKAQLNAAEKDRQARLAETESHRETALELQARSDEQREWPLRLSRREIVDSPKPNGITPLRIIFSPPREMLAAEVFPSLTNELDHMIEENYGSVDTFYPVHFLTDVWRNEELQGRAAVYSLWRALRKEPTLFLDLKKDDSDLVATFFHWSTYSIDGHLEKPLPFGVMT